VAIQAQAQRLAGLERRLNRTAKLVAELARGSLLAALAADDLRQRCLRRRARSGDRDADPGVPAGLRVDALACRVGVDRLLDRFDLLRDRGGDVVLRGQTPPDDTSSAPVVPVAPEVGSSS
jgi:hypothetical protein